MKKIILSIGILIAANLVLQGCRKVLIAEGTSADASVYFIYSPYLGTADSLGFSFATLDTSIKTDTVWMPVRLAGSPSSEDRVINIGADPITTTAVEGKHYAFLPAIMPKDSFSTQVGVVLYKTTDLADTTLTLTVEILPNSSFPVLMKDTTMADGINASSSEYKITLTDELTMPSDWQDYLVYVFGNYSRVKYQFIINATGMSQFPITMPYGQILYYLQVAQNALQQYEAVNGILYDENGNPVTIP